MKRVAFLIILAMFLSSLGGLCAESVKYSSSVIYHTRVNVVSIDLNDPQIIIKPVLAQKNTGKSYSAERFSSFIKRLKPVAAINGTYHDTSTLHPVGTIIIDGKIASVGSHGTLVGITYTGEIEFRLTNGSNKFYIPWVFYQQGICSGPTLVYQGKIYLQPRKERFKDPRVLGYAPRSALGVTKDNKLLLVTVRTSINLKKLAKIMYALGCQNAVTLDGGGSSSLYYKGKYVTYTNRRLTNILAVYKNENAVDTLTAQR